ncbi:hypothetical protein L873DRAFT_1701105 [Choiromyces venosus 120613-1]|uniref:Uncharacterized protein n=1 Tax=Choiromyces venosus 120613-1 TaxID=1336337 RepID=A0A3N4JDL8_9PEZI|nr:hypothetical protein L873DRAFT_1701105 [Choiromyces venosus 120613-1]
MNNTPSPSPLQSSTPPPPESSKRQAFVLTPNNSTPIRTSDEIPRILQRRSTLTSAGSRIRHSRFFRNRRRLHRERAYQTHAAEAHGSHPEEEGSPVHRDEIANISPNPIDVLRAACPRVKLASDINRPHTNDGDLPVYDDLRTYLVAEADGIMQLRREIDRLVEVVKNPDKPLSFSDPLIRKEEFQVGHRKLSNVSQLLMNTIYICSLDNDGIAMEVNARLVSKQKIKKYMQSLSQDLASNSGDLAEAQNEEGRIATGNPSESDLESIYSLVDYVTAVLARLITQSAYGDYWNNNTLGVLAKWATKAKVLLQNLPAYSSIALKNMESILEGTEESETSRSKSDEEEVEDDCEEVRNEMLQESTEDTAIREYCLHQIAFRSGIEQVLKSILTSLRYLKRSGLPMTSYEVCAVVYETGFEGFKALLFQDRDYEFSTTSDLNNLNIAHSAFGILNQSLLGLEQRRREFPDAPPAPGASLRTTVEWTYSEEENQSQGPVGYSHQQGTDRHKLQLSNMEDIISVMVPLAATSPYLLATLNSFKDMIYLQGNVEDVVRPYAESKFDAFFRMFTNEFGDDSSHIDAQHVLRLSRAVNNGLFSRNTLIEATNNQKATAEKKLTALWEGLAEEMGEWIYEENSVIVNCAVYVWVVIFMAASLVAGGLAIGFTVNTRLKGVDPFNITTYAWVLAAFVVLICKSMVVENWCWRDFLLRRVRCRCVSELRAVTGISDQLIMAKLLHDESRTNLTTRGPYNAVFQRKSQDGSGFSIDRPMSTRTMLLSGLTLLKVVTPTGHALVCLDGRRGTDHQVVVHRKLDGEEHLVCEDITRSRLQTVGQTSQLLRLPLQKSKKLKWRKVQGVYNELDAVFV